FPWDPRRTALRDPARRHRGTPDATTPGPVRFPFPTRRSIMPDPTPTGTGNVPEDVRQQIINEFLASHPNVLIEPQGDSLLARSQARLQNHLWPDELRLYKAASVAWTILGPVFVGNYTLQKAYPDFYTYFTESRDKAADTRKGNDALLSQWEQDQKAALQK